MKLNSIFEIHEIDKKFFLFFFDIIQESYIPKIFGLLYTECEKIGLIIDINKKNVLWISTNIFTGSYSLNYSNWVLNNYNVYGVVFTKSEHASKVKVFLEKSYIWNKLST